MISSRLVTGQFIAIYYIGNMSTENYIIIIMMAVFANF